MKFTILLATSVLAAWSAMPLFAQEGHTGPEITAAAAHDVSPPLRDLQPAVRGRDAQREKPLRPIPQNVLHTNAPDPVVQSSASPFVGTTAGLNFAGVGQGDYGFSPDAAPPDTNGAVGVTQLRSVGE